MHCSLISSSVHGISQAKILEWIAISSSRVFSQPRDWTHISFTGRWILYHCATWEALRTDTDRQNALASYVRFELKAIIEGENQIYSKWPLASLTLIDHKDLLIQFVYNTSLWEMDISWHISKQRRSQSSEIAAPTDGELMSPKGTQEGKNTCNPAAITMQPHSTESSKEAQDVEKQDTGPR